MEETDNHPAQNWHPVKKAFILFIIVYLFIYIAPLEYIPTISDWLYKYIDLANMWIGKHLLHLSVKIEEGPNGSGDTSMAYTSLFSSLVAAFILSALIFFIDRKRNDYRKLYGLLIICARYFLAFTMLGYGFVKIFDSQFPPPSLNHLEKTYGSSSPMGLLWTFMGSSWPYTAFGGAAEVLGGYLLFFRKTKTLGAIICFGVLLNIAALNFCYDVPVKIFSVHLLFLSLVILSPDLKNIYKFFIRHQQAVLPAAQINFQKRWQTIGRIILKCLFIAGTSFICIYQGYDGMNEYGAFAPKPLLYGVYNTETFVLNNDTIPPLLTDTTRWRRIAFDHTVAVTAMNDVTAFYEPSIDTTLKTINLTSFADSSQQNGFTYSLHDSILSLSGKWKGHALNASFKKKGPEKYLLVSRGFHWVNEYPYNR